MQVRNDLGLLSCKDRTEEFQVIIRIVEESRLVDQRLCPIVSCIVLMALSNAGSFATSKKSEKIPSFYGSVHPCAYLGRMMSLVETWSEKDKGTFVLRSIEAIGWIGKNGNTQLVDSDEEMLQLARIFPIFKGKPLEEGTVRHIGEALRSVHPEIVPLARKYQPSYFSFLGHASPACYFEEKYASVPSGFGISSPKYRAMLRELKAGALWEAKNPRLNYGLSPRTPFVVWIQRRSPKKPLKVSALGVSVTTLYKAISH